TRAQNIHALLSATRGRQDTAHCDGCRDASMGSLFEATPMIGRWSFRGGGCGKQRMDALRRRVSHGWLTEPGSNPRPGTTPTAGLIQSPAARMRLRIAALRNGFLRKDPYHSSSNTHRMDVNDRCRTLRDRVSAVPRPGRTAGRRTAAEPAPEG